MESKHTIIHLLNKHHFYDSENNRKRILDANKILYDYAKKRKEGTSFYNSAIAVATEIASKRFNCDTVLAALFYNVPYDELKSNNYTDFYRFQNILDTYIHLERALETLYCHRKKDTFKPDIAGAMPDLDPQAFAIRIAVQKDNIRNANNSNGELSNMADFTKNILVPILRKAKAYKDEDELLELCLKAEEPAVYQDIKSHLEKYRKSRKSTIENTLMKLSHLFDPNNKMIPDSLKNFQVYIKDFRIDSRKIYSIYRNLKTKYSSNDFGRLLKNDNSIAFYNCTIILKDFKIDERQKKLFYADLFFSYYKDVLCKDHIYVLDYGLTTHKDASFFTICDDTNNKYRIFIKSETEYFEYVYGNILEKHSIDFLPEKCEHIINVYKKDGASESIIAGATVLDLAFKIHGDLVLHFDYATRNHNPTHEGPYTVLAKGDNVEIHQTNRITADLNWFQYVKTEAGTKYLVKYFLKKQDFDKKRTYIEILSEDKEVLLIEKGATVLDYAFMLDPHLGRCFSHALINSDGVLYSPDTILNNKDHVIIHTSSKYTIKKEWLHFVNTALAKKEISKYLKMGSSLI